MEKINLNFFGEEVTINIPEDISSLKAQIAEKYFLSNSDVAEIILYYVKDSKKIYIINGNDFSIFKESKIPTIFLDVNQNSKLYLDNVTQIKKATEEKKVEETKVEEKKEEIDIEKGKQEIEKLKLEKVEIDKQMKEKNQLYNDKLSILIKQIVEMEKLKNDFSMERDLDMEEFRDKKKEIDKKIEEIKKKIEPKKEEVILKAAPKPVTSGYQIRSGQNNFPYSQAALKANFENQRKYMERFKAAKEKRMKERQALAEKKASEEKNEVILKSTKIKMPDVMPIFEKVNDVLNRTVQRVKLLAREKIMTKEEKDVARKEEDIKKQKEKAKKEQIEKIQKIARDAVNEINDLTKLVIEQSNSLIERINNPQLYRSSSSDDILLRAAPPKLEKKEKPEVHYHVMCDGCKVTPLRGNRYKCKQCKDFDFCEDCYKKNKESHGHDFYVIAHPRCRNRPGHPNKQYCNRGIIHSKVMCDGCGMLPISGWRYKCSICDDYNLCENCEERIGRKHDHPFIKITYSLLLNKFNQNYLKLNTYEPKNQE